MYLPVQCCDGCGNLPLTSPSRGPAGEHSWWRPSAALLYNPSHWPLSDWPQLMTKWQRELRREREFLCILMAWEKKKKQQQWNSVLWEENFFHLTWSSAFLAYEDMKGKVKIDTVSKCREKKSIELLQVRPKYQSLEESRKQIISYH